MLCFPTICLVPFFKPHVYSIGEEAVRMLKQSFAENTDTSIIISGESGSGKVLLQYSYILAIICCV